MVFPGDHSEPCLQLRLSSLKKKNYFFLAVLGLCCCVGFSLVVASEGYSLVVVCGLLIVLASLAVENGL